MSKQKAGIGIILTKRFLNRFDHGVDWQVVCPGRIGILRLRGSCGSLDLCVCYLDSGNVQERSAACAQLAAQMMSSSKVLSIVFGDFNFVESAEDRLDKSTGLWAGLSNDRESQRFHMDLLRRWDLHEWAQPELTCEMPLFRSRVDRCDTNMALSEQQDKHIECVALEWTHGLSSHRLLHFARTSPSRHNRKRPLQENGSIRLVERLPKVIFTSNKTVKNKNQQRVGKKSNAAKTGKA